MSTVNINANPGQTISFSANVLSQGLWGNLVDGYMPFIESVIDPTGAAVGGYPVPLTRISVGTYRGSFVVPSSTTNLGTYILRVVYQGPVPDPHTGVANFYDTYLINVSLPLGNLAVYPS